MFQTSPVIRECSVHSCYNTQILEIWIVRREMLGEQADIVLFSIQTLVYGLFFFKNKS